MLIQPSLNLFKQSLQELDAFYEFSDLFWGNFQLIPKVVKRLGAIGDNGG